MRTKTRQWICATALVTTLLLAPVAAQAMPASGRTAEATSVTSLDEFLAGLWQIWEGLQGLFSQPAAAKPGIEPPPKGDPTADDLITTGDEPTDLGPLIDPVG